MVLNAGAALLSRLRAFVLLRYTLIAATAYLMLVEERFAVPPVWVCAVIAMALVSNVLVSQLPDRVLDSRYFAAGMILADTTWITAALISSGRFEVDFFFLYFFVLLLAAMGESLGLIAVAAVAVCLAYVYVLSSSGETWSMWNSPSIIRLPFLFTAAAFYGYMIDRTRRVERHAAVAQEQAQLRGDALAAVARQFRKPLGGVLSWTNLLLDTPLGRAERQYAERVRQHGQELLTIVDGVLDVAVMEAGEVQLDLVAFELPVVVEETCGSFLDAACQKGLTLTQEVDTHMPLLLLGAPDRIRQVLSNLLDNAIKFTDRGGVGVSVQLVARTAEEAIVGFEVRDSGRGIPPEYHSRLFTPLDPDLGADVPAPGALGLAIARQLVTAMGGVLSFTSAPGHGSTFFFTVRFTEVAARESSTGAGEETELAS